MQEEAGIRVLPKLPSKLSCAVLVSHSAFSHFGGGNRPFLVAFHLSYWDTGGSKGKNEGLTRNVVHKLSSMLSSMHYDEKIISSLNKMSNFRTKKTSFLSRRSSGHLTKSRQTDVNSEETT